MKLLVFSICVIVFLFSCKKEKTEWISDWSLPILNDTISLKNLVNDSTLSIDNTSYYELNLHRTLLDLNLTDLIKIPDTTINESYSIAFPSITLTPGSTYINPSQVNEHRFDINDSELKKIRLKKGWLTITLKNVVNTKIFVTITLPGVTKNGTTFQHIYPAPAGSLTNPGIITETIDLSGFFLDLTGPNAATYNVIQSLVSVKTDPNGPTVTIKNNDVTKFQANFKGLEIDYARGYFGNKILSDTSNFQIAAFNKISNGSINLPSSEIKLNISNGTKINAIAKINFLKNINRQQNIVNLSHSQIGQDITLDPATGSVDNFTPSKKTILFNSNNSNIKNYLENLGSNHSIGYTIELNPWGNISGGWNEIYPSSKINVSIDASMPLSLGLNGLIIQDTFDINFNQDNKKTHINSGKLIANLQNAFPFSGQISLQLLAEDNSILFSVPASSKIESSLYGTPIGNGLYLKNSSINFILNEEIIQNIGQVKKIVAIVDFNSPNATTNLNTLQHIPENAYLGIKMKAAFELNNKY